MQSADNRNDFDKLSRRMAKLDPPGFLAWITGLPASALRFVTWEDTRNMPFPQEPNRTCDTVASFTNFLANGEPWLLVIEFQSSPDALMFGRLGRYMMDLWLERRPDAESGSRYWVSGSVVNLTGIGNASRKMEVPEAGLCTRLDFIERNLQTESAANLLQQIEAGHVARCVLPFVVLMTEGDEPAIIQKWIELALQEPSEEARKEYGFTVQGLAELRGREGPWNQALKEWNVVKSKFVEQFVQMGEKQNEDSVNQRMQKELTDLLGQRFQAIPTDLSESVGKLTDMEKLLQTLRVVWSASTLEEFRTKTGL